MIREFKEDDFIKLIAIAKRAWHNIFEYYRNKLGEDVYLLINPNYPDGKAFELRCHLNNHPDCFFVAERNGEVVGFITFYCDKNRKIGIISNNAVDPACGEKGVGQEMYQKVLEYFRGRGMLLAQVTTGLDGAHAPARRAYERAGFNLSTESVTYTMKL
jgi:RimJ/RimL family protein N-acetyltransferase